MNVKGSCSFAMCGLVVSMVLGGGFVLRAQAPLPAQGAAAVTTQPMAADADPSFEVATVKPNVPGARFTPTAGRQFYQAGRTVKDLVVYAYGVQPQQVVGGPDWMSKDRFDIAGVPDVEGVPSAEQWHIMVRKLLASRFKLTQHREKQVLPVYVLSVAKGGPKLTKNTDGRKTGLDMSIANGVKLMAVNEAMSDFVSVLGGVLLGRPVLDQTGVQGGYDFRLTFSTDGLRFGNMMPPASDGTVPSPNLFAAVQDLGLKLDAEKAPVDVIVVDGVERPSEN